MTPYTCDRLPAVLDWEKQQNIDRLIAGTYGIAEFIHMGL